MLVEYWRFSKQNHSILLIIITKLLYCLFFLMKKIFVFHWHSRFHDKDKQWQTFLTTFSLKILNVELQVNKHDDVVKSGKKYIYLCKISSHNQLYTLFLCSLFSFLTFCLQHFFSLLSPIYMRQMHIKHSHSKFSSFWISHEMSLRL